MEVREIKTLDDIVLAYKKGQQLINTTNNKFIRILGFVEGTNEILLEVPSIRQPLCIDLEMCKRSYKIVISNKEENKMEGYIERMIVEHQELVERIDKLDKFVHDPETPTRINPVSYANKCVQLKGMKIYEDALRAELHNQGVEIAGDNYYAKLQIVDEEESPADND